MTDLTIQQGTDSGVRWLVNDADGDPYDFTGWSVRAQIRRTADSSTVLHEWTTGTGNATAGSTGYVTLTWDHATTSAWEWSYGVYDLEIVSPAGNVTRLDSGAVELSREVTR